MSDKEYNLLHEPWIRVMKEDCQIEEVSLTNALVHAHEYRSLAGEVPTQDAAVLRVLLAVVHAVFERVDITGEAETIEDADSALERWTELWQNGRFPEDPLLEYFRKQEENFWLFHPTKPFWQIPSATRGTEYAASKMNGSLSESSNKIRLFSERTGIEKTCLTFSEAARWLLYVNAFDDTSAKPTSEGKAARDGKLPSPGAGWLGKIGYVYVSGSTLFETIMLNLVLLDDNNEPWTDCIPSWELASPRAEERTEIPVPHDQAKLLTVQSRRIILHRSGNFVSGYHLLGGDFFEKENAFSEQMTVWMPIKDKNKEIIGFQPKRHEKGRQMWRDMAAFIPTDVGTPLPGVIRWNNLLQRSKCLQPDRMLCISISSAQYGDKDFFVSDLFADSLSLHLNLLSELGEVYRRRISDLIARCDKAAGYIGKLSSDIFIASGGDLEKKNDPYKAAKEQYYYEIDVPFRRWLKSLDAYDSEELREQKIDNWCRKSDEIAQKLANKMVQDAGKPAFVGKNIIVDKKTKKFYSSSTAMQWFKINMNKLNKR